MWTKPRTLQKTRETQPQKIREAKNNLEKREKLKTNFSLKTRETV